MRIAIINSLYNIIMYVVICRGSDFRPANSELDSITAQLHVAAVLALAASATPSTIDEICKNLCMCDPVLITAIQTMQISSMQ